MKYVNLFYSSFDIQIMTISFPYSQSLLGLNGHLSERKLLLRILLTFYIYSFIRVLNSDTMVQVFFFSNLINIRDKQIFNVTVKNDSMSRFCTADQLL